MKLLYFAWVRQRIGLAAEDATPPAGVRDVAGLIAWLQTRAEGYRLAFADLDAVRVAVNQEHVGLDYPIKPGDEIAFFPPVTGG